MADIFYCLWIGSLSNIAYGFGDVVAKSGGNEIFQRHKAITRWWLGSAAFSQRRPDIAGIDEFLDSGEKILTVFGSLILC